jgi:hypothetical protein
MDPEKLGVILSIFADFLNSEVGLAKTPAQLTPGIELIILFAPVSNPLNPASLAAFTSTSFKDIPN